MGDRLTAYRAVEIGARIAFAACVVVVVVASLVPSEDVPGSTLLSDKLTHALGYAVLAGLGMLAGMRPAVAAGTAIGLGLLLECAQLLTGYRSFEWLDLAADAAGAVVAVLLLSRPLAHWRRREHERAQERKRAGRKARRLARAQPPERPMNRARAAARKGAPTWQQVAERQGRKCWLCGTSVQPDDSTRLADGSLKEGACYPAVDHVVSLDEGGTNVMDNVRLVHRVCKQRRVANAGRGQYTPPKRTYGR
jgi:VanZ family protein